jgi:hypothetical protein
MKLYGCNQGLVWIKKVADYVEKSKVFNVRKLATVGNPRSAYC